MSSHLPIKGLISNPLLQTHLPVIHVSPGLQFASELHCCIELPEHFIAGSPEVPDGHLHLNVPTEFSQMAPSPHGNALHSSMSIHALLTGNN